MKRLQGWFLSVVLLSITAGSAYAEWGIRHPLYHPLPQPQLPCCSNDGHCRLKLIDRLRACIQHHHGTCPYCGIPANNNYRPEDHPGLIRRLCNWLGKDSGPGCAGCEQSSVPPPIIQQ